MRKQIIFAIFLVFILAGSNRIALGQCTDVFVPDDNDIKEGFRSEVINAGTPAIKQARLEKGERIYPFVKARIDLPLHFKISLDNDATSGFTKTNDYMVFSVLENVYGIAEFKGWRKKKDSDEEERGKVIKRCVVIPKDTKIYGLVAHANSRYPFSIGGKAKLFVMLTTFPLRDSAGNVEKIRLEFAEPDEGYEADRKDEKLVRTCKYYPNRQCITGRREKLTFSPAIVGAGAGTGTVLLTTDDNNATTRTIAALSFLESLSKISGIDNLVNPPNAVLKSKMIFDIEAKVILEEKGKPVMKEDGTPVMKEALEVWVSGLPPEKPKEEKPKEDKKDEKL